MYNPPLSALLRQLKQEQYKTLMKSIQAIAEVTSAQKLLLHMDGARFANAVVRFGLFAC
jgi:threonine aldolase